MKPLQTNPKKNSSFWSKLSTASLDFSGGTFNLEFASKNGKYQTKFGGYLTLLVSFTVILSFILSSSQIFSDNSPVVNITPEYNPERVDLNLYEEDSITPLMFKKMDRLISTPEELSRYVTVKAQGSDWSFNGDTGRWKLNSAIDIPFRLCSQIAEKDTKTATFIDKLFQNKKKFKKYLFCPDLGDKAHLFITGKQNGVNDLRIARIKLYPCGLQDASNCATTPELSEIEVTIFSNNKVLEASNFDEPIKYSLKKHWFKLDPKSEKRLKFYSELRMVVDDSNQLRGSKNGKRFGVTQLEGDNLIDRDETKITCAPEEVAKGYFNRCQSYIWIDFFIRTDLVKIRRSYKKATVILGEFGGYLKLHMTVVFCVYSIYASKDLKKHLLGVLLPERVLDFNQAGNRRSNDQTQEEIKKTEETALELLESRVSVEGYLDKINLAEILEHRLLKEEDYPLISDFIQEKNHKETPFQQQPKNSKKC